MNIRERLKKSFEMKFLLELDNEPVSITKTMTDVQSGIKYLNKLKGQMDSFDKVDNKVLVDMNELNVLSDFFNVDGKNLLVNDSGFITKISLKTIIIIDLKGREYKLTDIDKNQDLYTNPLKSKELAISAFNDDNIESLGSL
jgi:hypothetical protein